MAKTNPNFLRYGAHISAWLSVFLVYALIFRSFLPWQVVLPRTAANVIPLALLFYGNGWWMRYAWSKKQVGLYAFGALGLFLAVALVRVTLNLHFPDIKREWGPIDPGFSYQIGAVLTNGAVMAVSIFFQFWYQQQERERRQQAFLHAQQSAQIQFLKAQINPHFLFNTLNNIYALAVLGSEKTPEMIQKLSELLRYVIYESQASQVSLEKELLQLRRFIDLFQMRSETPLPITLSFSGELAGKSVEPMVLIPLVENCLKHGDLDTNPHAFTDIRISAGRLSLTLETANTFSPEDRQRDRTGGVGLENIRRRLELRFPEKFSLQTSRKDQVFLVHLSLPYTENLTA